MTSKDICKICGGLMQLVHKISKLPVPCKCKDTFGWDPTAWHREQAKASRRAALPERPVA